MLNYTKETPGNLRLIIPVIILMLAYLPAAMAQKKAMKRYDFSAVRDTIQKWVDSGYYPGAAIIVVKDNKTIYEAYFGNYTHETVAYIASAGKWLAAATIAAVVEEGKLSWNDTVKNRIPEITGLKGEATLRQLLSHTAGYPDYQPPGRHPDNYASLKESVEHIAALPADTAPGTVFHYGGLAMQVAGRMAELAEGKDWESLFEEKIARPLQMHHTFFTPVDSTPGHNPMLGGGARTCLHDYVRFLAMISNNGVLEGRRVLSVHAIEAMQANQVGRAALRPGEYVQRARGSNRNDVYGLGEWREEVDAHGKATLLSSPSWAGAYPWIDKQYNLYGFFLARISHPKNGFTAFYASPVLPVMVRAILEAAGAKRINNASLLHQ